MSAEPQQPMVRCDWCGKMVPEDPRIFCEGGIEAVHGDDDDPAEAWKGERHTPDMSMLTDADKERMMAEMNLTREQVETLVKTGKVQTFQVVCLECMDSGIPVDEEDSE